MITGFLSMEHKIQNVLELLNLIFPRLQQYWIAIVIAATLLIQTFHYIIMFLSRFGPAEEPHTVVNRKLQFKYGKCLVIYKTKKCPCKTQGAEWPRNSKRIGANLFPLLQYSS